VVVSASRRTDVPAFYGDWLLNRLQAGYCEVVNPFNARQVSRVSLEPSDVDVLVLWTRYPKSLRARMTELTDSGYRVAVLYTIVDHPRMLEPSVPPLSRRIEAFRELCELLGPDAVVWRYDPVLLTNLTPPDYHRERFAAIADAIRDLNSRVIVSLFQPYTSVLRRLSRIDGLEVEDHTTRGPQVAAQLADIARERGMKLESCADPRLADVPGIGDGGCIDERLLRAAGMTEALPTRDTNQRSRCRCLASRDIGAYETCLFGCTYCYATHGPERARTNRKRHDPAAPALISGD
jgi:hypothetical protein